MKEFEVEVLKADPNKVVEVGSFRLDATGNAVRKTVKKKYKKKTMN